MGVKVKVERMMAKWGVCFFCFFQKKGGMFPLYPCSLKNNFFFLPHVSGKMHEGSPLLPGLDKQNRGILTPPDFCLKFFVRSCS